MRPTGMGTSPPPGLFDRITDLLAWDRQLWDVDPPDGWDPAGQCFLHGPRRNGGGSATW